MARVNEEVEHVTGEIEKYRRHPNGRGWVSPRAEVAPSAFVAEMAYVEPGARVAEEAWIGPGSWIDRGASVGKRVFIGANVHIGENAQLGSACRVGSHCRIGKDVTVAAMARLERDTMIPDGGTVEASSRAWSASAPASRPPSTGERRSRGLTRAA